MGYRWEGFRKPRGQVIGRIRDRIQELGLSGGYSEYKAYLEEHPEEWSALDRLCDVTISKFFRNRKMWEYLKEHTLPDLTDKPDNGGRPVAAWSIGCCNGEEAYSLAMIGERLTEESGETGSGRANRIGTLATDRNSHVLERARAGRYPAGALKELTEKEILRFFHPVNDGDESESAEDYRIDDRLKRPVRFERRDIRESMPEETFDLILCRNLVFTYFAEDEQHRFLHRLKSRLRDGGYLVAGANEQLPSGIEWLEQVTGTHPIFRRC